MSILIPFRSAFEPLRGVREQQGLRNAGFNSLDFLVRPLLFLIATPIYVLQLGADLYGLWMLALAFTGLSGVGSFGVGDATVRYVARYRARGDIAGVARVLGASMTLCLLFGTVAVGATYLAAPFLVTSVFRIPGEHQFMAIHALRLAGLGILVTYVHAVVQAGLFGYERYDLAAMTSTAASVATVAITVVLVIRGFGVLAMLAAGILMLLLDSAAKAVILKTRLLSGSRIRPTLDRSTIREVLGYGFFTWIQSVGSTLAGQLDKFIIVGFLSPAVLTYYAICLQLTSFIHGLGARAVAFIFPMASILHESGSATALRTLYFRAQTATAAIAGGLSLPVFLFAPEILALWINVEFAETATHLLRILSFAFALLATSIVPYYFLNGTGMVRLNAASTIASGATVALAAFVLVPWIGVAGAAWARLANLPVSLISRGILHRKVLRDTRILGGATTLLPVALPFALTILLLVVRPIPPPGPWWLFAAALTVAGAASAACVGVLSARAASLQTDPETPMPR